MINKYLLLNLLDNINDLIDDSDNETEKAKLEAKADLIEKVIQGDDDVDEDEIPNYNEDDEDYYKHQDGLDSDDDMDGEACKEDGDIY